LCAFTVKAVVGLTDLYILQPDLWCFCSVRVYHISYSHRWCTMWISLYAYLV